jgi:hypothetical protein
MALEERCSAELCISRHRCPEIVMVPTRCPVRAQINADKAHAPADELPQGSTFS